MANIYALLVAIDTYQDPIPSLGGCVNDANAMEALLRQRFGGDSPHLLRLNNKDATRDAVIKSFRQHLGQAKPGDVALFFYAGHGSQVPTGGLFKEIEPMGMNSSIVCWDSRVNGALDLVDKDIATLISEITRKDVRLISIFDSCHSGSVTRDLKAAPAAKAMKSAATLSMERKLPAREDAQNAKDYLASPDEMEKAVRALAAAPPGAASLTLCIAANYEPDTSGTHVLMAACETNQSANEYVGGGVRHGAFTYFLTQTLLTAPGSLGYRELMQLVRERMRDRIADQTPKLESPGGDTIFDTDFLGLTPAPLSNYSIATQRINETWTIDSGSLLGVAEGDRFALYPDTAASATLADPTKAITTATAAAVRPSETLLTVDDAAKLQGGLLYKAVLTARSSTIAVRFEGDDSGLAALRAAAVSASSIREGVDPIFIVHAAYSQFTITRAGSIQSIFGPVNQTPQGAQKVIAALEHMAQWTMRVNLSNSASQLPQESVQFVLTVKGADQKCPPLDRVEMAYGFDKFKQLPIKPSYKARVSSTWEKDLNIALLVFSDDWSISARLLGAGTQTLAASAGRIPDQAPYPVYAAEGKDIHCSVAANAAEATDILMLVVSTDWFDAHRFEMPALPDPNASTRGMDMDGDEPPPPLHDFFTRRVTFHTVRKAQ